MKSPLSPIFDNATSKILSPFVFKEVISDYEVCLPAVGQGVIGVETRSDDEEILKLVQLVNDKATTLCVQAERALQRHLEGGCQVPIGAYAYLEDDLLQLEGLVG